MSQPADSTPEHDPQLVVLMYGVARYKMAPERVEQCEVMFENRKGQRFTISLTPEGLLDVRAVKSLRSMLGVVPLAANRVLIGAVAEEK